MKILKLNHAQAEAITAGGQRSTWRLYDDKDLRVGDEIELIDKVDPTDRSSWTIIGVASINRIVETKLVAAGVSLGDARRAYGDAVTEDTPVKIIDFDLTPVQADFQPGQPPSLGPIKEVKLYADGGSRGNPGPSASGFVILDMQDRKLVDEGLYLGVTTNNQAEYLALKIGLERALSLHARVVHVYMDSMLVVNQMKGIYKVKNRDLWAVHQAIVELLPKFEKVQFTHVPREFNRLADAAVNRVMDESIDKD